MPDKKLFCSSLWHHIKISYGGAYTPCRWLSSTNPEWFGVSVRNSSILEYYNSDLMKKLRMGFLTDGGPSECSSCYYQDSFGKVSGRIKQLARSKINVDAFDESFVSSPDYEQFMHSANNNGHSIGHPHDLQISLGNTCNGACIMCYPYLSSRLHQDYLKLTTIAPDIFKMPLKIKYWDENPKLVDKVVQYVKELPSISYIHLLGGETLILKSFYAICDALIESGLSTKTALGTTTNLNLYPDNIEFIIPKFYIFHIGLSIESINPLNDYIRYPAKIDGVMENLSRFLALRTRMPNLHLTLRITPNIFTIYYLDEVIQYMCDHEITAESCDILIYPGCLRIELLPEYLRVATIEKLKKVIDKNSLEDTIVINTRDSNLVKKVIGSVAYSYVNFLEKMVAPDDIEQSRRDLVTFLNGFEGLRYNSILDYAPEYTDFLIEYGYKSVTSNYKINNI